MLDVLLRKVFKIAGVELRERKYINFVSGVSGVDNPATGATDLTFGGANAPVDSLVVTGTVTYQGTKLRILDIPAEVSTTDATVTTIASFTMLDETLCAFDVLVTAAMKTDLDKGGRWKRSVVYRRTDAGGPAIVGALESGTDEETDAAMDVTIDVSGNAVRVRVTGIAATNFQWACVLRVQETKGT